MNAETARINAPLVKPSRLIPFAQRKIKRLSDKNRHASKGMPKPVGYTMARLRQEERAADLWIR